MRDESSFNIEVVIGGAQKSGTTKLHKHLGEYSDICVTNPKEARIFLPNTLFEQEDNRDDINLAYRKYFPKTIDGRIFLDSTPEYFFIPIAAKRIQAYNPSMKWIICLRNPIARCYSQWKMRFRNGTETRDFLSCVKEADQALKANLPNGFRRPADLQGLLSRGLYYQQIHRIERLFGSHNVQYIFTANMRQDLEKTLDICRNFILKGAVTTNTSIGRSCPFVDIYPCDESLKMLKTFYEPEIERMKIHFDINFDHWLSDPLSD